MISDQDGGDEELNVGDFVLAEVRANPGIGFAEVRAKGEARGFKVFPIVFGRAKRMVAMEDRESPPSQVEAGPVMRPVAAERERATRPEAARAPAKRGRGRPMSPEMAFAIEFLASAPNARAKDVVAAASKNALAVTGAIVARARMRLGAKKARSSEGEHKSADEAMAKSPRAVERRPTQDRAPAPQVMSRERVAPAVDFMAIVESVRNIEAERDELRDALAQIARVIERIRGIPLRQE